MKFLLHVENTLLVLQFSFKPNKSNKTVSVQEGDYGFGSQSASVNAIICPSAQSVDNYPVKYPFISWTRYERRTTGGLGLMVHLHYLFNPHYY